MKSSAKYYLMQIISRLALFARPSALVLLLLGSPGLAWHDSPPLQAEPEASRLPDLQTLPPHDFRLTANQATGQKILRFSNSIVNNGPGVFELNGTYIPENDTIAVTQYLYGAQEDDPLQYPVGEFELDRQHYHWHWPEFALYEIIAVRPDGQRQAEALSINKVGYCMYDAHPVGEEWLAENELTGLDVAPEREYDQCGWRQQGLSVGWVDLYAWDAPGQTLDVSDLDNGLYLLRSTVDPDSMIIEANRNNNTAAVYFYLSDDQVFVLGETLDTVRLPAQPAG